MYKTVVVDDEVHARNELIHQLNSFNDFEVVAECGNAIEGMKAVKAHSPDVVFLDIQMPGLSGFDMLSMLDSVPMPHVIFVTAYDEYAIRAFEEKALDYLLKPIDPKRLIQAVNRVEVALNKASDIQYDLDPLSKIPCSLNNVIKLVNVSDVCHVVSDHTGVHVVTECEALLTDLTMKVLEQRTKLFRCHRQYLLNIDMIDEIHLLENGAAEALTKNNKVLPISRRSLKELKQLIGMR